MNGIPAKPLFRLIFAFVLTLSGTALAQTGSARITGRVFDASGNPVTDATVTVVELRRSVRVDAGGSFAFENIPSRHYHIVAESPRLGRASGEADLTGVSSRVVEIVIDPAVHAEEIVVTAGVDTRRASEVYQPINVLGEEEVAERLQATIGETLNQEPGVNSTYFGPGSSRPIIRGLGADRIRILSQGLGANDASNVSPDHAVSVDPATAEQIEILRGPATLLYGSNAVGGVVNILDERIPRSVPTQRIGGHAELRGGTVADERGGSLVLNGGAGTLAWHADLVLRETDDYAIPGPADKHDDEPEELTGFLENSSLQTRSGTVGLSYVGARGYVGLAVNSFGTKYGVPGHEHHEEAQEEESGGVRIDLDQRRFDLQGELTNLGTFFRNARIRIGRTDYEHVELEGEEVGTRFTSEGLEGRIEASHRQIGRIRGSWGLQISDVDLQAEGEEAFIPPNSTRSAAVFAFEEIVGNRLDWQFGARVESQDVSTSAEGLPDRSFDGLSGSLGAIFRPAAEWVLALSLARAVRLPTATELYANGPHAATRQFEIGDPNLQDEESLGIDLSFRRTAGRLRGEINVFQNYFDGYIFETATGEEEDGLPVFQFIQADARFRGIEIDLHTELWHAGDRHLELEAGGDYVRATLADDANLPRIPPLRLRAGLRWRSGPLTATAEVWRHAKQNRIAAHEDETDGYNMVNAMVSYRFIAANMVHDLMLRGTNLTDELARVHTSPLKELAPLPGRDFTLSYRVTF